jgi:single-strand DNA-binding protein
MGPRTPGGSRKKVSMAEGLNRVMLLGNLGQDPDLRFTQGGQAVLNLRLATTESYMDRDRVRKERTDWHNVVIWGKRAEALSKILHKGSSIFVEGSLRTSSFEGRDGQKRYKTEVNARNVLLTGGGGGGRRQSDDREDRDSPREPTPPPPEYEDAAPNFGPDDDDDIPF